MLVVTMRTSHTSGSPATLPERELKATSTLNSDFFPLPPEELDLALQPAGIGTARETKYQKADRRFQGVPGIAVTTSGRLWATWYAGGADEGSENHVLLARSDDAGLTWSPPLAAIDPPGNIRAFDPVLWIDPRGKLWWFWSQSAGLAGSPTFDGRAGVFGTCCVRPDDLEPSWSPPRRISHGVMMNKPTVRADGAWLLPCAIWASFRPEITHVRFPELAAERFSNVIVSQDEGQTFRHLGGADVPDRTFDEHMIVERRDGSLWMLVRTSSGIGESVSRDGGQTWTPGAPTSLPACDSRFHICRLRSGNLLFLSHAGDPHFLRETGHGGMWRGRSHLTAWLSRDDGQTWPASLELDPRGNVSYPDAAQGEDGSIFVIYDRERYRCREILLARIAESDIEQGKLTSESSFLLRPMEA